MSILVDIVWELFCFCFFGVLFEIMIWIMCTSNGQMGPEWKRRPIHSMWDENRKRRFKKRMAKGGER